MSRLYRMNFQGNLPAGDVFNHSLWVTGSDSSLITDAATASAAAAAALTTTASGMQSQFTTPTVWAGTVVEEVTQATGVSVSTGSSSFTHAGTNGSASSLPGQCALVVTLRTATVSRRGRGRFYLPPMANSATTPTGRLNATASTAVTLSLNAFFNALKTFVVPFTPVVYSPTGRTVATVTSYDFGDVFDTQRRRRNKLVESRVGASI
jgi:hypothetical protein